MTEPRSSRLRAVGVVLLLVVTGWVSVVVDRYLASGGSDHEEHEGHGEEGHDEEGHDDGERGDDEHRDHSVGTVRLSEEQRREAKLLIVPAGAGLVEETHMLPGEVALNADLVAHVSPRTSGAVRDVKKFVGDRVVKGDVLAVIDSKELAGMHQEVLSAGARLSLAEANFERIETLFREKITSEKEFLAAKQALEEARIDRNSAAQKMSAGAGNTGAAGGLALVSPIDGTVLEKHVTIGEVVKEDTEAFVVADLSTLWVWVTVYARDLPKVAVGKEVSIRADAIEEPLEGTVTYVEPVLDERSRTARARILVTDPAAGWRAGLFVKADVVVGTIDAPVVVPEDALQRFGKDNIVFVEEDGAFEARRVELGRFGRDPSGTRVREIVSGLTAGEAVVAGNAFVLKAEMGKGAAGHEH